MPIYEYACQACGHQLDALQKVSDPVLRKCPECGALKLKRLVSAPQFRLKGTGWYETDFKKDGKKRVLDGGGDAAPAKEAAASDKGEGKADAKPDGKDAAKPPKAEPVAGKKSKKAASRASAGD